MAWTAPVVRAAEPAHLVGVKKCKMCHNKASTGNQYQKWVDGPHSKALKTLAGKEAKAVAAELGIADPQKSGKCLKCHSTAYYFTEKVQNEKIAVAESVSCESCHGPGKNYKAKSVMQNRAKSIAKGMIHLRPVAALNAIMTPPPRGRPTATPRKTARRRAST